MFEVGDLLRELELLVEILFALAGAEGGRGDVAGSGGGSARCSYCTFVSLRLFTPGIESAQVTHQLNVAAHVGARTPWAPEADP